jgi:predicted transcriptional regulator
MNNLNNKYFIVPNDVFKLGLNSYQLSVYFYLCRCSNNGKVAFPSYEGLGCILVMSRGQAIKIINQLCAIGLIEKQVRKKSKGSNYSNLYKIMALPQIVLDRKKEGFSSEPYSHHGEPYKELLYKELPI